MRILIALSLLLVSCAEPEMVQPPPVKRVVPAPVVFSPPAGFTRLRFGLVPVLAADTMRASHKRLADHLAKTLSVEVELIVADS